MIIRQENTLIEDTPKTYLSASESAGTSVLRWKNNSGFSASWAIQLGETGEEKSEVLLLDTGVPVAASGTTTANSTFEHPADTPIYAIKYDQVVFERSITGTSGVAAPITDGTLTIQADNKYTQFDDTSGSVSYTYKTYYKNSVLNVTTSESDWIIPGGYSMYSLGKIKERTRGKLLNNTYISDDELTDWSNEWLEDMTNTAIDVNQDYVLGTTEVAYSGTAQEGTISAADFKQVRRAWHSSGNSTFMMIKQDFTDFTPNEEFNETRPFFYMKGDSIIGRNPHGSSGTISLTYYKLNAVLDSDSDELPVCMRGYSRSCVKWCLAQGYRKDKMITEAEKLEMQVEMDKERFKRELTPRHKSGPSYIKIVEGFPTEEEMFLE